MSGEISAIRQSVADLRAAGRRPAFPFLLALGDGSELRVDKLLRVLPGKRIVGVGAWRGQAVLAKLFVAAGSARHGQCEVDGLAALQAAAIATPALLYHDAIPGGGQVVLTDFLSRAETLADAWAPYAEGAPARDPAEAVLAPAFAALGQLHAAGLVQDDAHLGNFLRQDDVLYVIDGDAVRRVAPTDAQVFDANLALLLAQLPPAWDAHWAVLLAAYASAARRSAPTREALRVAVLAQRDRRREEFLAKIGRECTLFAVRRTGTRFEAVARHASAVLAGLLADPDRAVQGGLMLKDGRTCTVAQINDPQAGALVIKRYNLKNVWHALGRSWRPSRAWHSWREGHRLRFYGIATPEPLVVLEERLGPLRRRAFLVNVFCPGRDLLAVLDPDRPPPADVGHALVVFFSTLHALRISHGDFKATNLLWHAGRIVVIDLDAMIQHRAAEAHAAAWRRDRARFLRNWPADSVLQRWLDARLPPA